MRLQASTFQAGPLCGISHYGAEHGMGFVHVLWSGRLEVQHFAADSHEVPARWAAEQPTLLFYPRPLDHRFVIPRDAPCEVVCASVRFDGPAHPVALALPAFLAVPLAESPQLAATVQMLFAEAQAVQSGERLLADRLFEVLLIQLIRHRLAQAGAFETGLLAGLADPALSRALTAMHTQPAHAWTLPELAERAGLSRSVLAERFRAVVGTTPMEHLAHWRLSLAQQGLRRGTALKRLADELGYGSASALSRAFRERLGASPRAWLAAQRGSALPGGTPLAGPGLSPHGEKP